MREIHRWPVNSPHKWPVTRKMFPFDDVIIEALRVFVSSRHIAFPGNKTWVLEFLWRKFRLLWFHPKYHSIFNIQVVWMDLDKEYIKAGVNGASFVWSWTKGIICNISICIYQNVHTIGTKSLTTVWNDKHWIWSHIMCWQIRVLFFILFLFCFLCL